MHVIPILSTVVTFGFTVAVLNRYFRKGGIHLLLWGVGLILYGLGTLTEVILGLAFNSLAIKLWYLCGAMLTAAWLGQGTFNLLVRRRGVAMTMNILLGVVSLAAITLLLFAPLTSAAASFDIAKPVSTQYKDILTRNGGVIFLTIILNIYGTICLVGGALYSAYLFWRKRVLLNRVIGNILIAAGALMPAMAGSLVKAGLVDALYLSELLGVIIMFLGFWQATTPQTVSRTETATASVR